jgi:hypothetical protein
VGLFVFSFRIGPCRGDVSGVSGQYGPGRTVVDDDDPAHPVDP